MAILCEGGNDPAGSLKATNNRKHSTVVGYTRWDHKRNEEVMEELGLKPILHCIPGQLDGPSTTDVIPQIPKSCVSLSPSRKEITGTSQETLEEQFFFETVTGHMV
ncbi:hypothetical protein ANN_27084 [Periplaneta americana]|uniref:Per a allergen n=1 Tax=Periplaneta americana TaxID=6978 RepID=A0ABQ8RXC1_PERAM|nr:hypothetical protein ANN_27084 [Periplaneta americana]